MDDWDTWIKEAAGSGHKVFVAIPFTKSILSSLTEAWVFDENLVHLFVTDGGPPLGIKTGADSPNPTTVSVDMSQR